MIIGDGNHSELGLLGMETTEKSFQDIMDTQLQTSSCEQSISHFSCHFEAKDLNTTKKAPQRQQSPQLTS